MEIQIIDREPDTGKIFFKLKAKKLTGISKLVQIVVLSLMNVPGQDVLDPDKGGGLPALLGSNIDPNDSVEVLAEIARRVRKTEQEIIDFQIGVNDSPEEKLRELRILGIENGNPDEIFVRLRVINELGQATDVVF